jgi:hypothetical protein
MQLALTKEEINIANCLLQIANYFFCQFQNYEQL